MYEIHGSIRATSMELGLARSLKRAKGENAFLGSTKNH